MPSLTELWQFYIFFVVIKILPRPECYTFSHLVEINTRKIQEKYSQSYLILLGVSCHRPPPHPGSSSSGPPAWWWPQAGSPRHRPGPAGRCSQLSPRQSINKQTHTHNRRRINTDEKAKVVAAAWRTESLAILYQDE